MTGTGDSTQRDRSPAHPNIALDAALKLLHQFDAHFRRSGARPETVGNAWGIKGRARVDRTIAALRYFGLLEYQGTGTSRQIVVSDEGRKYLRAQQEEIRHEVVKEAALRPKQIAKFWHAWGPGDRPADPACIDELVFQHGFSERGARCFLKVYDATIDYARLAGSDKMPPEDQDGDDPHEARERSDPMPSPPKGEARVMEDERELITGLLSKSASFRLIVRGEIGEKEIERLIKKLEFDKEILADSEGSEGAEENDADQ